MEPDPTPFREIVAFWTGVVRLSWLRTIFSGGAGMIVGGAVSFLLLGPYGAVLGSVAATDARPSIVLAVAVGLVVAVIVFLIGMASIPARLDKQRRAEIQTLRDRLNALVDSQAAAKKHRRISRVLRESLESRTAKVREAVEAAASEACKVKYAGASAILADAARQVREYVASIQSELSGTVWADEFGGPNDQPWDTLGKEVNPVGAWAVGLSDEWIISNAFEKLAKAINTAENRIRSIVGHIDGATPNMPPNVPSGTNNPT